MFFKERSNRKIETLAPSRQWMKKAGRLFVALAISGGLWGGGSTAASAETILGTYTTTDSTSVAGTTEISTIHGTPLPSTPTSTEGNVASGKSYDFTNPSSGNTITFDENGYTSNNTPTIYANNGNTVVEIDGDNGASNNHLTINGGTYDIICGGSSPSGNIDNNTVIFNGGTANIIMAGARSYTTTVGNTMDYGSGNTLTINGGTVGYALGNTVNIYGGTIAGYYNQASATTSETSVIAVAPTNASSPGAINIYNFPNLSEATLAGFSSTDSNITANLNIHTKNLTAQNISNFNSINFYLPSNIANGDTVLTLTNGSTNLSNTAIRAGVEGNANLSTGDTVTLIKNANGIVTDSTTTYGTLSEGVSLDYGLTVEKADETSIVARVGSVTSTPSGPASGADTGISPSAPGLKTQTEFLPTSLPASSAMVIQGTDRLLDWLPPDDPVTAEDTSGQKDEAGEAGKADSPNDFQIFANMGFSSLRTKTGSNSYTDTHNGGFDLGAARTLENRHGKLVFAPIVDYGTGSYDSYSDNGMHGKGNSKYWAVGMIARQMNYNGFYYEASFRGGRTMVDFSSDDFMQGTTPTTVTYDASAPCFAGHIRIGKLMQFGPSNQLHIYGIYSHNHQNGMSAQLSTGETYNFSSVDSGRLRIGGRLSWQKSKNQKFYSGIAYQYDFSTGATGSYRGYSTSSSNIRGSSAMIELGWQIKPTARSPWMVDIGATGWVGHQKGFTVQAKLMKSF